MVSLSDCLYVYMFLQARELLSSNPEVLGNDPITTATAVVTIRLTDINDNCPEFDQREYTVRIREDIPEGSNIPLQMTVTDKDSVRMCLCVCINYHLYGCTLEGVFLHMCCSEQGKWRGCTYAPPTLALPCPSTPWVLLHSYTPHTHTPPTTPMPHPDLSRS